MCVCETLCVGVYCMHVSLCLLLQGGGGEGGAGITVRERERERWRKEPSGLLVQRWPGFCVYPAETVA